MSLCGAIQMQTLRVTIPAREACYAIQVHSANLGAIGEFARSCVAKSELALVVCDAAVKSYADVVLQALEQQGFRSSLAVVPSGESSKSLEMAARLYDALIELPADRQTLIVAARWRSYRRLSRICRGHIQSRFTAAYGADHFAGYGG
jgi:3-dehydroquinate synthase